ncbi:hypothetical protein H2200_005916 [Cladophialophora chaetospira]|uniref:DUF7918 domain-containing protein n=1 Tax=Cladophialophora chaetospira TaxID=386627 RepID=A0AA38X9Z2_9EURO|nr:hypothetical protein H2200_005916 [Cladophialophora chaetospira]
MAMQFNANRRGAPRELRKSPKRTISKKVDRTLVATFIFKYRSKNALQVLGVIPRSPSPVPLEARDPTSLSHEEAVELIRRQQVQLDAANVKIKKENTEVAGKFIPFKREARDYLGAIGGSRKRARQEVVTIDLTDD